jgi:hypothetical protein
MLEDEQSIGIATTSTDEETLTGRDEYLPEMRARYVT